MTSTETARSGTALVAVVLITLALFAVGHALLTLSLGELAAARAGARQLEARAAAESAVQSALAGPGQAWLDSVAVDGEHVAAMWSVGRAHGTSSAWRLSREAWWLEGVGHVEIGTSRAARLAWALDPLERTLALDAALTAGWSADVVVAGSVEAGGASTGDPTRDVDCEPWRGELEAHYLTDPLEAVAVHAAGDTVPRLGFLELDDLLAAVEIPVDGIVTPTPTETLGTCAEADPWNWGDPQHAWRPCGGYLALRGSQGDLEMRGGSGQGIVVVGGNLELGAGAHFYGLAIVRGALLIAEEAQLVGAAIAYGAVRVSTGGSVRGSACWVVRSLAAQRATLGRLRLVPGASLGPL
jgi:hypothetical protein